MLNCPFCGGGETSRVSMDGKVTVIFRCMFSPTLKDGMSDEEMRQFIAENYGEKGSEYLQGKCEEWHFMLTRERS